MSSLLTHQQPGGDGDDVGHRVLSGDVLAGFGDVAEDIAVDDSAEDEVNMADQDERQSISHQPPLPFGSIWMTDIKENNEHLTFESLNAIMSSLSVGKPTVTVHLPQTLFGISILQFLVIYWPTYRLQRYSCSQ